MPVNVSQLKEANQFDNFMARVAEFTSPDVSEDDRQDILSTLLEVADTSGLIGVDMMRTLTKFLKDGKQRPGLYTELVKIDRTIVGGPVKTPSPRGGVKAPATLKHDVKDFPGHVVHPQRPTYLKDFSYLYPAPRSIRWQNLTIEVCRMDAAFFDTLVGKEFTRDEAKSMTIAAGLNDSWFDKIWSNYVTGKESKWGYRISDLGDGRFKFEVMTLEVPQNA